ncbi:MAG: type II secretion system protein [Planctomycetota bacterium]
MPPGVDWAVAEFDDLDAGCAPAGVGRPARRSPMGRLATRSGFTLVEILIVVVILGVLAAIVVPQAANAAGNAAQTAFARNVKQFADVATMHRAREGFWIGDSGSGTLPDVLRTTSTPRRGRTARPSRALGTASRVPTTTSRSVSASTFRPPTSRRTRTTWPSSMRSSTMAT